MSRIHNTVRTQFSRHAEYYARSSVHSRGDTLAAITNFAQPMSQERTLDIATGTGFTAFAIAPKVARVIATDLTSEMLFKARELALERGLANIEFQLAAAESLPFANESFDLVTCRIAPHHFQNVRSFLAEAYRVLRPSGRFCMVDSVCPESERLIEWQNSVEKMRDASHVWAYPPSQWREMISDAEFSIEGEAQTQNAEIQFSWWVQWEETPVALRNRLRLRFEELSHADATIYSLRREEDEIYFTWPMYAVKARKLR